MFSVWNSFLDKSFVVLMLMLIWRVECNRWVKTTQPYIVRATLVSMAMCMWHCHVAWWYSNILCVISWITKFRKSSSTTKSQSLCYLEPNTWKHAKLPSVVECGLSTLNLSCKFVCPHFECTKPVQYLLPTCYLINEFMMNMLHL